MTVTGRSSRTLLERIEHLKELSSISSKEIQSGAHPYERASEEERETYDRTIEELALHRDARDLALRSEDQ